MLPSTHIQLGEGLFETLQKMRSDTGSYWDKITLSSMGDKKMWHNPSWQPTMRRGHSSNAYTWSLWETMLFQWEQWELLQESRIEAKRPWNRQCNANASPYEYWMYWMKTACRASRRMTLVELESTRRIPERCSSSRIPSSLLRLAD